VVASKHCSKYSSATPSETSEAYAAEYTVTGNFFSIHESSAHGFSLPPFSVTFLS